MSKPFPPLLTILGLVVIVTGCVTPDSNPAHARRNTGYVDFHADSAGPLCWSVGRLDEATQVFETVFSDLSPLPDSVLRLASVPGLYKFRVSFFNRVSSKPVDVVVQVHDGKVTPVLIMLKESGTMSVVTRDVSRGGTVKGRYGQRSKIGSNETTTYDLFATASDPVPYQPKEQMPHAR